jgi:hypothetical protein
MYRATTVPFVVDDSAAESVAIEAFGVTVTADAQYFAAVRDFLPPCAVR